MQGSASVSSVGNQAITDTSVAKNVITSGAYLTSKLHVLVAFNQYLDDDEVYEAHQTYKYCGACMIELGANIKSSAEWPSLPL